MPPEIISTTPFPAAPAVRERPILFSAPMVHALLAGTKTQTRRIAKVEDTMGRASILAPRRGNSTASTFLLPEHAALAAAACCPYGRPGDRLWVREAFRFLDSFDGDSPSRVGERCVDAGYRKPWAPTRYEVDGLMRNWMTVGTPTYPPTPPAPGKLRPSMFMPRWASRILLEVTDVRVERLQDISAEDCFAEGIDLRVETPAKTQYARLWDEINGDGAWEANPWVWAVSFRRVPPTGGISETPSGGSTA